MPISSISSHVRSSRFSMVLYCCDCSISKYWSKPIAWRHPSTEFYKETPRIMHLRSSNKSRELLHNQFIETSLYSAVFNCFISQTVKDVAMGFTYTVYCYLVLTGIWSGIPSCMRSLLISRVNFFLLPGFVIPIAVKSYKVKQAPNIKQ